MERYVAVEKKDLPKATIEPSTMRREIDA